jgi:hypothetical protein
LINSAGCAVSMPLSFGKKERRNEEAIPVAPRSCVGHALHAVVPPGSH